MQCFGAEDGYAHSSANIQHIQRRSSCNFCCFGLPPFLSLDVISRSLYRSRHCRFTISSSRALASNLLTASHSFLCASCHHCMFSQHPKSCAFSVFVVMHSLGSANSISPLRRRRMFLLHAVSCSMISSAHGELCCSRVHGGSSYTSCSPSLFGMPLCATANRIFFSGCVVLRVESQSV